MTYCSEMRDPKGAVREVLVFFEYNLPVLSDLAAVNDFLTAAAERMQHKGTHP